MLNNISLVGRLTKDPESRFLTDGREVVTFTLAVQRTKEVADFIPCEVWGKVAESVREYVTKGSMIGVEGSLRIDTSQNQEGEFRTYTKVSVGKVHFIDLKRADTEEPDYSEGYDL